MPPPESINEKIEDRKCVVKELPEKGDKGSYKNNYNNRRNQGGYDRRRNTQYERKNNDGASLEKN